MTNGLALQLVEGDRKVRRSIANLQFLLNCPSPHPTWLSRLRREVEFFCENLAHHYALQEQDGYLEETESHAPSCHDQLMRCHDKQSHLVQELENLCNKLADRSIKLPAWSLQLREILVQVQELEERKNLLTLDAFNVEPGGQDGY